MRFISDYIGDALTHDRSITVMGSDDGEKFWTLLGEFTSSDRVALQVSDYGWRAGFRYVLCVIARHVVSRHALPRTRMTSSRHALK